MLKIKEAVEQAQCRNLASAYAKEPNSLTVTSIAQLQICLGQTLQAKGVPAIPKKAFDIQTPHPLTNSVDTTLPTPPTPPTPPQPIKIE